MEIQNYDDLVKYRVYTIVGLFTFVTLYTLSAFKIFTNKVYDMPVINYLVIVSVLMTIIFIYTLYLNVSFFYFNDEEGKLKFKYFSLRVFGSKRNAIEIEKTDLYKFEIEKLLGGRKINLILYTKTKKGVAKYTPISLTSVRKSNIKTLTETLNLYAIKKG